MALSSKGPPCPPSHDDLHQRWSTTKRKHNATPRCKLPPITSSNKTDLLGTAFFTFHQDEWWGPYREIAMCGSGTNSSRNDLQVFQSLLLRKMRQPSSCLVPKEASAAIQTVLIGILLIPSRSAKGRKQSEPSLICVELYEWRRGRLRNTEDGPTPWRLSGLSSKKGELWLILARNFELHMLHFLCSLERSVLDRSRFRSSLFLPGSAFLLRIWKRLRCSWLGKGFQCSGNGRVLNFACHEDGPLFLFSKKVKSGFF